MKLSEAIRLGSMLRPQKTGGDDDGKGACALLAACLAVGIPGMKTRMHERSVDYSALWKRWPMLGNTTTHPGDGTENVRMSEIIWDLNDRPGYGWSRERIADWVEGIELQEEARVRHEAEVARLEVVGLEGPDVAERPQLEQPAEMVPAGTQQT